MQLAQLSVINGARRAHHEVGARGRLREGDDLANRLHAHNLGDEPVDAQGNATVGRSAVAEGAQQVAELAFRLFLADADNAKYALLNGGVV